MGHRLALGFATPRSSVRIGVLIASLTACVVAAPLACGNSEGQTAGPPHQVTPSKDAQAEPEAAVEAGPDGTDAPLFTFCKSDKECAGNANGKYCDLKTGQCQACSTTDTSSCPSGFYCDPKSFACVVVCTAGAFHCACNEVMQCDPGPPATWISLSTPVICDATKGEACNAKTGTCETLTPTGTTTPTGTYFQYAVFTTDNSEFKGGCGLDSEGDNIYVNRDGQNLDVYKVMLEDTDGDGKLEPAQHPDNVLAQGPMEKRTLKYLKTYTAAADKAPIGVPWDTEIFALPDRIMSNGPTPNGSVVEYLFATQATNMIAVPTVPWAADPLQILGYGEQDELWYAGDAYARRVYSFCRAKQTWVAEFAFPSLAGDHFDGLEVVVAPKTKVQYVYVSDMQSDFLGQYRRDDNGGWVQENLFKYNDGTGADVEGMGFGALHHFWAGNCGYPAGSSGVHWLYEIGGGDLDSYTSPVE